jgi:hypothetical protein
MSKQGSGLVPLREAPKPEDAGYVLTTAGDVTRLSDALAEVRASIKCNVQQEEQQRATVSCPAFHLSVSVLGHACSLGSSLRGGRVIVHLFT